MPGTKLLPLKPTRIRRSAKRRYPHQNHLPISNCASRYHELILSG